MAVTTNPFYEQQRLRAQQQAKAQEDEALQALRRRLAAQGGLSGGAGLQIEQQIREKGQQMLGGQLQDITAQEAQFNLQQQEAEKARQFQAGESALARQAQEALLGRQLTSQEALLGKQLTSQERLQQMGQQFQAGESAQERAARLGLQQEAQKFQAGESSLARQFAQQQQVTQNEFAKIESSLGRDAALKLQQVQNDAAVQLKNLDMGIQREGFINQKDLQDIQIRSNERLDALRTEYLKAKDLADRGIIEKQIKNEVTSGLMSQAIDLAQMAKAGLAPSEVAGMINSFLGQAVQIKPDGSFSINPNWQPAATIPAGSSYSPLTNPSINVNVGAGPIRGVGPGSR
jgi:hypothetical protein